MAGTDLGEVLFLDVNTRLGDQGRDVLLRSWILEGRSVERAVLGGAGARATPRLKGHRWAPSQRLRRRWQLPLTQWLVY